MFTGLLLSFASFAAYSISDAFIKIVHNLDGSIAPYTIAYYAAIFGFIALPFIKTRDEQWRDVIIPRYWSIWLLRAAASTVSFIGAIVAFSHLAMAEAFTLIFMQPAFVSIFSIIFLKEHVGWRRWLAIVVGFAGVLVVLRPGFRELNIGHAGALACGITGAIGIIIIRCMQAKEKRITLYASSLIGLFFICGLMTRPLFGVPLDMDWQNHILADIHVFASMAAFGLLAAVGSVLIMAAAKRVPASLVSTPQYSQMIWAIIFGYLLFDDHLDIYIGVGIVLILISSIMTFIREEQRGISLPRSTAPPESVAIPPQPPQPPQEAQTEKLSQPAKGIS